MTALLIDQNIQDAITFALNNPVSAIVCPYSDNSDKIEETLLNFTNKTTEFVKTVNEVLTNNKKIRSGLLEDFAASYVTQRTINGLDEFIEIVDERSLFFTKEFNKNNEVMKSFMSKQKKSKSKFEERFQKQFGRREKAQFDLLDDVSEMSLFLRALRAKYNPHRQLSEPFANKHDLERYLDNLIA